MAEIFTWGGGETTGIINDSSSSLSKTYSSNKIEALVTPKANKSNGIENEILLRDANWNPKTSGKKIGDFSESNHTHNANEVVLSTTNFGNVLDNANINTLQKLADFIDDNIGFGRSLEFNWSGTQLGIKQEWDPSFQYVNLKWDTGRWLEFAWTWTQLGVRLEWSVGAYSYVDLEWPKGEDGKDLEFVWVGTQLWVRKIGDPTYTFKELKWDTGNGIASYVRISWNNSPWTTDVYRITFTNWGIVNVPVTHGANGTGAMQTVTTEVGSLVQIDNTDPANPVFSLGSISESDITDLDKYTQQQVNDAITALQILLRDGVATEWDTLKKLLTKIEGIQTLIASDNVNLDSVQELVDAIEDVQSSLSNILVNDLTTGGTTKALTAEMGKTLKGLIDALTTVVAWKEPAFTKNTGFNKAFGTTAWSVSEWNHNHDNRYYTESESDDRNIVQGSSRYWRVLSVWYDLDTLTSSWFYQISWAINRPADAVSWGHIEVVSRDTAYVKQTFTALTSEPRMWTRTKISSSWNDWEEVMFATSFSKIFELWQRARNESVSWSSHWRWVLIEKEAKSSWEASWRIFFPEHNSTSSWADNYGFSIWHQWDAWMSLPSGFTGGKGNATWGASRHDNSLNGIPVYWGSRISDVVNFNKIQLNPWLEWGLDIIHTWNWASQLNLYWSWQWGGKVYVWQTSLHGWGIEYNGSLMPWSSWAWDDFTALYRRNAWSDAWVAKWGYANDYIFSKRQRYDADWTLTDDKDLVHKKYVDTQLASAGWFPKVIWTSTPQSTATFTYYTFTHGQWLVSGDVTSGRYGIMITYTVWGYGRTILGWASHTWSDWLYGNTQWTSGNPSADTYVAFQANTLKIYTNNSGSLWATTNMRIHLIQKW